MKASPFTTLGVLAAAGVLLLSGCTAGTTTSDLDASGSPGSDDCGVTPTVAPDDPDGAVAALSAENQELYNGYAYTVRASDWADWAPDGEGPYTVGIAWATLQNPYQVALLDAIEQGLEASDQIADVVTTTATSNDVSAQIQQYSALVQQGVDLIVYQPNGTDAFVAAVEEAAAQGIPSIAVQNAVPSASSVNIQSNQYQVANNAINGVIEAIGGEGNLIGVHGVPGAAADTGTFNAIQDALDRCAGIEVVGELTGNFDSSVAKSEVLQFLSSYSGEIAGVFQPAVMAPGIVSAFVESGLDVPTVTDIAAQQASLAYWRDNRDTYQGVGIGQSPTATGDAVVTVALRMLAGDGITVSDVVLNLPVISDDNLDEWVEDEWDLTSVGTAPGPDDVVLVADTYLDNIFTTKN